MKYIILTLLLIGTVLASSLSSPIAHTRLQNTVLVIVGPGGLGSGFVLQAPSHKFYLMTNAHVCLVAARAGLVRASYPDGETTVGFIHKMGAVESDDLCAIEIQSPRDYLTLAKTYGTGRVYSRGYPLGILAESEGTYGGVYSDGRMIIQWIDTMYGDHGMSGSPVVNWLGHVVGVISRGRDDVGIIGMLPLSVVSTFVEDL